MDRPPAPKAMSATKAEPDTLELAKARAEHGEAVRALRTATQEAATGDLYARRHLGEAQDRVNRAAARLAGLASGPPGP